jgi:bacteriocin biosynthesis cyclodehydratase domain-containing protein
VGPLVEPGRSACLRCADASGRGAPPSLRTITTPVPLAPAAEPLLANLVAALLAHEIGVWASGFLPQTCGAVLEVPYGGGPISRRVIPMHPYCGCGWSAEQDTMGA